MRLSPHFTLAELTRTSHRKIDNNPNGEIVGRLRLLCEILLEPVRERFGPLWITSGFRCEGLNNAIGGSRTSAHVHGRAADFVPMRAVKTIEIVDWICDESGLPFDQVIDEYSSTSNWIHLGLPRPSREARRQALTMRGGKYFAFDRGLIP